MPEFKFRMDVPLVPQARNNSCWYAAACMVAYYREAGPRLGLPQVWQDDTGVTTAQKSALARAEGLSLFPLPRTKRFTNGNLYAGLKQAGPLWCDGDWDGGSAHAIVMTGIDGDTLYFNDPWPVNRGVRDRRMSLGDFNRYLYWADDNCILYQPPRF